jgi:hypothetical protein
MRSSSLLNHIFECHSALQDDIKRHLFSIVIASPAGIRKQLNEALGIIAKSDFHEKWPALLPELVSNLDKPGTQIAVLEAMAAVFHPMREMVIDDCNDTLDYCQKTAAGKVIAVVQVRPPSQSASAWRIAHGSTSCAAAAASVIVIIACQHGHMCTRLVAAPTACGLRHAALGSVDCESPRGGRAPVECACGHV